MPAEHLLSLDLGTSSVRALVVGADGVVAARASRPLETHFPGPGRVEQDPEALWRCSLSALRGALESARLRAGDIAGIGIANQRATAIAWDAVTGESLCPAIGWQDCRTQDRVAEIVALGVPFSAMPSATKFEWWLRNDVAVRAAAKSGRLRLGTPDAWLAAKLSGDFRGVTDPGNASATALYDAPKRDWSDRALSFFEIERAWLPRIAATAEQVGETRRAVLGAPVPLAARAGDQQAACFAHGLSRPGDAKLTLGTSAMLEVHTGNTLQAAPPGAFALPLWDLGPGARPFCLEGSVITAGAAVDWLVQLGVVASAAGLDALAGSVPNGEGVVFVPALQGLGSPFGDDRARGLVLGLTRGSTGAHLARALIDGVAQRCSDVCESLHPELSALHVDGGLARSNLLLHTLADLLGCSVLRAKETETTALGAAFLAGVATGLLSGPSDLHGKTAAPDRFEPRLSKDQRLQQRSVWRRALARCTAH